MLNGKLVKLKIIAYADASYGEETGRFDALANPSEFTENVEVQYSKKQPPGSSVNDPDYLKTLPQKLKFKILFDGTGTIKPSDNPIRQIRNEMTREGEVVKQIDKFKAVCLNYKGTTHQPNYLKVLWGGLLFKGRLTSLSINYNLFSRGGLPLRATGDATFVGSIDQSLRNAMENNSSPDLTHSRQVKAGDTLPLLTNQIYGTPSYYIDVARNNKLPHFRAIPAGKVLFFHPLRTVSDGADS